MGCYFAHFFRCHPNNGTHSDRHAQWWPQWHRYSTVNGIIEYGPYILHQPPHQPDPTRFIAWLDTNDFTDPGVALFGPFDTTTPPKGLRQHVPNNILNLYAATLPASPRLRSLTIATTLARVHDDPSGNRGRVINTKLFCRLEQRDVIFSVTHLNNNQRIASKSVCPPPALARTLSKAEKFRSDTTCTVPSLRRPYSTSLCVS